MSRVHFRFFNLLSSTANQNPELISSLVKMVSNFFFCARALHDKDNVINVSLALGAGVSLFGNIDSQLSEESFKHIFPLLEGMQLCKHSRCGILRSNVDISNFAVGPINSYTNIKNRDEFKFYCRMFTILIKIRQKCAKSCISMVQSH